MPTYDIRDIDFPEGDKMATSLATQIAGEDLPNDVLKVETRFSYSNITVTTANTVKSGVGFLHLLTINNPVALASATTATTIALYDNTAGSGTLIGTISLPLSANLVTALPITVRLDVAFTVGLTTLITLGAGGVWTPNITVSYR